MIGKLIGALVGRELDRRDGSSGVKGAVLGAASYRCLDSQHLFARLGDPVLSALVRQFVSAAPDGPVRFHYAAAPIAEDFGLGAGR